MSEKHDAMKQVRLTRQNVKKLQYVQRKFTVKPSFNATANRAIELGVGELLKTTEINR